jgi:hypothetical protein
MANILGWITRVWAVICVIRGLGGIFASMTNYWNGPSVFATLATYSIQSYLLVLVALWALTNLSSSKSQE